MESDEVEVSSRIQAWRGYLQGNPQALKRLERLIDLRYSIARHERPGWEVYPINQKGKLGKVSFPPNGNLLYRWKTFTTDGVYESYVPYP